VIDERLGLSGDVDSEKGNYDLPHVADLDYAHRKSKRMSGLGVLALEGNHLERNRFDAVKHFSEDFLRSYTLWMKCMVRAGLCGEF